MDYKVCDDIIHSFLNFSGVMDKKMSFHTLLSIGLLIHAGINVNPC